LTSPPELFNFIDILKKKKQSGKKKVIVLYPDPPLGANEIGVLNELDNEISFVTPVQLSSMI
jgi:hypothetical protein